MLHLEVLQGILSGAIDDVEQEHDLPPACEGLEDGRLETMDVGRVPVLVQKQNVGGRNVRHQRIEADERPTADRDHSDFWSDRLAAERDRRQYGQADGGGKSHRYFSNFE